MRLWIEERRWRRAFTITIFLLLIGLLTSLYTNDDTIRLVFLSIFNIGIGSIISLTYIEAKVLKDDKE